MRPTALALLLALSACAGPLEDAESLFDQGQYPKARQALARLEQESRGWEPGKRAEYALYRGLDFGALGDAARARVWLGRAKAAERERPGTLSPQDERRLEIAIATFEVP